MRDGDANRLVLIAEEIDQLANQSGEEVPPAPAAGGGGDAGSDRPDEKGYVRNPVDLSSYIPATEIVNRHSTGLLVTMTPKMLGEIVENYNANHNPVDATYEQNGGADEETS